MWAQIINACIGLFLMVSPSFFTMSKVAADNNHTVGPLVITFAVIAIWEVNRNTRFFNILTGVWLVLSPFILGFGEDGMMLNIVSGIGVISLSLVKGKIDNKYGGGWRSLLQNKPAHMQTGANNNA